VGDDQVRDEDDHDLLTFAESGIRLREEISLTEAELGQSPDAVRRAALQARLSALHKERGFLDYAPRRPGVTGDEET